VSGPRRRQEQQDPGAGWGHSQCGPTVSTSAVQSVNHCNDIHVGLLAGIISDLYCFPWFLQYISKVVSSNGCDAVVPYYLLIQLSWWSLYSGMWCHLVWEIVTNISEEPGASIFKSAASADQPYTDHHSWHYPVLT
jgi:hypothetical protein